MGCTSSKLDGLPAVALCRDRCNFLAEALRHSYALADAHAAYLQSLKTVGPALHGFFDQAVESPSGGDSDAEEAPDKCSPASSSSLHSLSSSDSESGPKFDSDSEEEERSKDGDCDLLFNCPKEEALISDHDPFMPMDYMKNQPAQSIFCSSYGSNSYRNYNSGTRTPPPPPAPSSSAWDFINFFESYEHFPYTVTGKDLKDKETTCDHEDGSMKKIQKAENFFRDQRKIVAEEEKINPKVPEKNDQEAKKKNDSDKDKESSKKSASGESKSENVKSQYVSEVTKELQDLFKKASEAGNEVSKMFDSAKFRYYYKSSVYQVSSNILYTVNPSFLGLSSPSSNKMNSLDPYPGEDFGVDFSNLSSTLKKLCIWEKKLYQEVKAEEKLRTAHAKNYKQLRRLEEKGSDYVHKVESTRAIIRSLSTRMRVSIHMIDKICVMINKLRDEELWSQMRELIHRLSEMWSCMRECHRNQSRIISEARKLDAITLKGNLDMAQLELAIELKVELRRWSLTLSNWIEAQKQYVKALNGWLMRCLMQEPQESTPDFIDAPPMFGIIHQWSQALQRSTENEVSEAVYALLMLINCQTEKQKVEMQERNTIDDKDIERKLLILEKEEQKMQKYYTQSRERKMNISSVESMVSSSLKSSLEQIFTSVEKLATKSKQAYEDLDLMCK